MSTALLGSAGEHLVVSELLRLSYIPTFAPSGFPDVDIIVHKVDADYTTLAPLQVKACSGNGGWRMLPKHETAKAGLFFAFVDFGRQPAEIFVVPSEVVATLVYRSHRAWPGGIGRPENGIRKVRRQYGFHVKDFGNGWIERYHDQWKQLEDGPLPFRAVE